MFNGAIFDMDGTILDSMGVWQDITVNFLKSRGFTPTEEELLAYRDMTMDESMPAIKKKYGLSEEPAELKSIFSKLGYDAYMHTVPAKPYIKEYMQKLKNSGVKIAIATSGYKELCEGAMRRLGMLDFIDAIALSCEVGVNKSNPDVYLLAAQRLDIAPEKCMVFEDILLGIKGAQKGNFQTTAIYDFSNEADIELLKKTADRYIKNWKELL